MRPIFFNAHDGKICLGITVDYYCKFHEEVCKNKRHADWFREHHSDTEDLLLYPISGISKKIPYIRISGFADPLSREETEKLFETLEEIDMFTFNKNKCDWHIKDVIYNGEDKELI